MKTLTTGLLLTASLAFAQQAPSADVEQLWLDPAGRGSLFVGNGRTLAAGEFRAGVVGFYTHGNLRSTQAGTFTDLLQDRFGFQVFGALGLFNWLELGATVPVYVYQQGTTGLQLASSGLGNPMLQAKVNLLDAHQPISLAVVVGVGIPVGTGAAQGSSGFLDAVPRLQIGRVFDKWQFGVELGYLHRATVDFSPLTSSTVDKVGSQTFLAVMVSTVNPEGPRGEFTFRGFIPMAGGMPGLEGQLGFRWALGPVELIASAGPGFGGHTTTPSLRAYFGVAFANRPMTQPTCVEGRDYSLSECPDLDRDGDGVLNKADAAPLLAEDKDGFQDEDGAPDADNDGDGSLDGDDECPDVAGVAANKGCPAKDTDGDTVFDHEDNCPAEKGLVENAGCPTGRKGGQATFPSR